MATISSETKEPAREKEGSTTSIPNKLLEFQKRVSAISKDSVNPFFKSKYFDINTVIDTIKPVLNEIGLVITQGFDYKMDQNILVTKVMDGSTCVAISEMMIPIQLDVQKLGAAITYCRRYALVSLLFLQGEIDDDGNSQAISKPKPYQAKAFTPKPNIVAPQEETAPTIEIKDNFKIWTDKVKMAQDLETINGYAENLKFATKTMKASEVALLRSQFANKRKELETGEIVI